MRIQWIDNLSNKLESIKDMIKEIHNVVLGMKDYQRTNHSYLRDVRFRLEDIQANSEVGKASTTTIVKELDKRLKFSDCTYYSDMRIIREEAPNVYEGLRDYFYNEMKINLKNMKED